jgi:hypothetical protein
VHPLCADFKVPLYQDVLVFLKKVQTVSFVVEDLILDLFEEAYPIRAELSDYEINDGRGT